MDSNDVISYLNVIAAQHSNGCDVTGMLEYICSITLRKKDRSLLSAVYSFGMSLGIPNDENYFPHTAMVYVKGHEFALKIFDDAKTVKAFSNDGWK